MSEIATELDTGRGIARVELRRPPHNFLDAFYLADLHDALAELDRNEACRCILLSAQGRNFSAGRDFGGERRPGDTSEAVYAQGVRIMAIGLPVIAAVQGAAVGAGFGLAMVADFRLCSERAYFSANFVAHGLHHGFGMTATLPHAIGAANAADLLLSGRRLSAGEALEMGLVKAVVAEDQLLDHAFAFAEQIAKSPRAAIRSIRRTLRDPLEAKFSEGVALESERQNELRAQGIASG